MKEKTIPAKQTSETLQATREDSRYLCPAVDIYEQEDKLIVICDVPGVAGDGISVGVDENILTIRGKALERQEDVSKELYREYKLADFFRQFELSEEVDQEQISADLKHGVLTIHLPKAEKAKPRKIEIQVTE